MEEPSQHHGLVLKSNPAIRDFLAVVASSADRPSFEICSTARKYMSTDAVPYMVIRDIWMQMEPSRRPRFYSLLAGVTFVLASPKPREKSKELKDRLQKLQEAADRKAYDSLVRDVALKEDKEFFFLLQRSTWIWSACYCNNVHWLFGGTCNISSFVWAQSSHECCRRHFWIGIWDAP